jgi:ergothioneine biosynthesis protein EgtB
VVLSRETVLDRYRTVRAFTERLCEPLEIEDHVVQSMADASPTKWHLGHTSWFFETFVLLRAVASYRPIDERYAFVFNSYYDAVGDRQPQARRGLLSRPTVAQVRAYRRHVDHHVERFLEDSPAGAFREHAFAIELGLHHEQQHQELILTDIKHAFLASPLHPRYVEATPPAAEFAPAGSAWLEFDGGLVETGHDGEGFAFDNEGPRHRTYLDPFELPDRLSTCSEYVEFIEAGGYRDPRLWLADGWDLRCGEKWDSPLYWKHNGNEWTVKTLGGHRPVHPHEPVCHVSYYEADAFARWSGARLPREEEWEVAASRHAVAGNFVESGRLHPSPAAGGAAHQFFGDAWEWTASPYVPYPGYVPFPGALGEYNGKFMSGRMVLRGGSCASPTTHIRSTYRNFFLPSARWQFSGIRLARDLASKGRRGPVDRP